MQFGRNLLGRYFSAPGRTSIPRGPYAQGVRNFSNDSQSPLIVRIIHKIAPAPALTVVICFSCWIADPLLNSWSQKKMGKKYSELSRSRNEADELQAKKERLRKENQKLREKVSAMRTSIKQ